MQARQSGPWPYFPPRAPQYDVNVQVPAPPPPAVSLWEYRTFPTAALNDDTLYIDMFERWQLPVVLCARTALGTINHSLLSVEALRKRRIDILGIAFIGESNPESERAICAFGQVRRLGRLPLLSPLTADTLQAAFRDSFRREDFNP